VRQPRVVELVGPAGAGKSTVLHLITTRASLVHASVWDLPRPLLIASAIRTLPTMIAVVARSGALPWEELKQIIRLDALRHHLDRLRCTNDQGIVMDEGPVLGMAWLRVLGPSCFCDGRMDRWWERTLNAWAPMLDGIVLLDAPDPVLVHRIRTRSKSHEYRDRPDEELIQFLAAYRRALGWVSGGMNARAGTLVIPIDSDSAEPVEIADRVLATLEDTVHAR
jgi:hypothetical protein